jgi:hypothetical protein
MRIVSFLTDPPSGPDAVDRSLPGDDGTWSA